MFPKTVKWNYLIYMQYNFVMSLVRKFKRVKIRIKTVFVQPPSRQWLKGNLRDLSLLKKQQITSSLSEKDITWKGELNSTSTYIPAQLNIKWKINVKIDKCELPTYYWLPTIHKNPFESRFISNSSHWFTTSKHITSALTAVKHHIIKTAKLLFAIVMKIIFGPSKTLPRSSKSCDCEIFRVLKYLLSTFPLYTTQKLLSPVNCCFNREL